jgi:hypothetical protein
MRPPKASAFAPSKLAPSKLAPSTVARSETVSVVVIVILL